MEETTLAHVRIGMSDKLTKAEMDAIDMLLGTIQVRTEDIPLEPPVWRSKPFFRRGAVPLPLEHEAASENFLVAELEGRCRLSEHTRRLEEKRIAARDRKRKPYSKKAKGRFHHSHRRKMKRLARERQWDKEPLERVKHVFRQGVVISQEQWDRLIAPVWEKGCKIKQVVWDGPLTVYNIVVVRDGQVVYNGPDQAILDAQDPRFAAEVLKKRTPEVLKKPPLGSL